jgi:hypothetical protein
VLETNPERFSDDLGKGGTIVTLPFSDLLSRTPFAWLRERDVDLLVCSELHANGALTRLFATRIAPEGAKFAGAWVSHAEVDGESDMVVVFTTGELRVVALIENKIAASFQPEQAERYAARALRWRTIVGVSRVVTVLLAPEQYMDRSGSSSFDERISYEVASGALRSEKDPRSMFLADALEAGVKSYHQGYVMKPDGRVSDMWMACWKTSQMVAPALRFQRPGLKPGRSTWFYFRDADGFSADRKRAVIAYKAERGQVDLQFADTRSASLAQRVEGLLDGTMKVVPAEKSASVRITVSPVDFQGAAVEQEPSIVEGFAACERLRVFFVENREQLLSN